MRSLGALYRYQGKNEAAEIMEEYAMGTCKQVSVKVNPSKKATTISQNPLTDLLMNVLSPNLSHDLLFLITHLFLMTGTLQIHTTDLSS